MSGEPFETPVARVFFERDRPMRILHASTNERRGGAGRAANRLHQGLLGAGIDSQMLVQDRGSDSSTVHSARSKAGRALELLRPALEALPLRLLAPAGEGRFTPAWLPDRLGGELRRLQPDLLHLHWVGKGFLRIESLRRVRQPLVWTLHDMWPLTGGCFHSGECRRYESACGRCPVLGSRAENDLAHWVWRRKQRAWQGLKITLVCPSRWMAAQAARSALFAGSEPRLIPNGLDLERFAPLEGGFARRALGLDPSKRYLLFCASRPPANPFKGFERLPELFARLNDLGWGGKVELLLAGEAAADQVAGIPARVHRLGAISDEAALRLAYCAAQALVAPSRIDNLPNTIMEALACGTPAAAFGVGGIPEMIDHQQTGWLADPGDAAGLAAGLDWLLGEPERLARISRSARASAERKYDLRRITEAHLELYRELLEARQDV